MKKIFLWLISSVCALSAIAQTVTINVQGSRNKQVSVDGSVYNIDATTSTNRTPIVITGLSLGQHSLEVINGNANTSYNDQTISNVFRLRQGYDMHITIKNNGTFQTREVKATTSSVGSTGHPGQYKTPMSSTSFNTLIRNISRQSRQVSKYNMINNALNTTNYFTTSQVEQLVEEVNSQNYRVTLLKKAYLKTTDAENFATLYDLLNTQSGRDQVTAHVNSYNYNYGMASTGTHNAYVSPMTDATFNSIYQNAQNQWQSSLRMNYLVDALANASNYFTSNQARQLIQLVSSESDRLILAKTAYRGITDASNFYLIRNLLTSTTARNDLDAYVRSYTHTSSNPGTTTPVYRTPMTDASFRNLYNDISDEWLPGAELNALRQAFANTSYFFTSAQARELIELVSAEASRVELAKAAYRSITDPANFSTVYNLIPSQAGRNEVINYVNSYNSGTTGSTGTGTIYRQAMSDDSYNSLYRTVQNTWGLGAKMSSLTNIFANTSYYFTTDQARRLIELVSSESNRLQLAKSAYKQIVDPNLYFASVSQILSSQSSRNDLEVYIRNN